MRIRAQYSMEYLMVFTIIFATLIPIAFFIMQWITPQNCESVSNQVNVIGNQLISSVEQTYYSGYPGRTTINLKFPSGITNFSTISNNTASPGTNISSQKYLSITYQCSGKSNTVIFHSKVPMNISNYYDELLNRLNAGDKRFQIDATYTKGKNIILFSSITLK